MTQPAGWQRGRGACVPMRPLGVGDILDGAFRVLSRNPRAILGLSAVFAVIQAVVVGVFQFLLYRDFGQVKVTTTADGTSTSSNAGPLLGELTSIFSIVVIGALLGAVLTGMLTAIVTQDVLGTKLSMGQAWGRARTKIWPLLGLALVTTALEALGLIPLFVIGVWLWGIWAVAVPAMMVEGTTVRASLARSTQLVRGLFWRVWGIRALGWLIVAVIGEFVTIPFAVLGLIISGSGLSNLAGNGDSGLPTAVLLLTSVGSVISLTFTAPIKAAIDALLYVDLRMRKEGLDLVLQQQAAQRATPWLP